ncbi:helix-turn-helix transcriptional regulator [Shewanella mangrovisoli]|uniref:helix-turn-helix transcriptional regulator n=1 Tax=Shewanella mangrovisoli TaxID=2864211 RepID=UPI0035B7F4BC
MFGEILKKFRKNNQLTQGEMINLIISIDEIFSGVDEATYSRWENNHTCPSILKRCKILRAIHEEAELRAMLSDYTNDSFKYLHLVDTRFKHGYAGADHAYELESEIYYTYTNTMSEDLYNELDGFQSRIYNVSKNYEEVLAMIAGSNSLHIYIFKDRAGNRQGHFVFLDISIRAARECFAYRLPENFDFGLEENDNIIFILSEYALRKEITLFKFKVVKEYVIGKSISKYYSRAFIQSIANIYEKLGSEVIIRSPEANEMASIKYQGKAYQWLGFLGDIDNFLVSDLSGNADEYTEHINFIRID